MQPRLKSSTRWTPLPQDVILQIRDLFKENFQNELKGADIIVEGRIYPQEICLRVGYLEKGRLAQYNFEVSMDYKLTQADSALKCLSHCVDAAGSLMAEHFDDPENPPELPYSWTESDFDGKKVWVQHSTVNSALEKEASQLLGEDDENLVQGEVDDTELEASEELEEDLDQESDEDLDSDSDDEPDDDPDDDSGSGRTLH